jgi:hypothetical protein
MRRWQSSCFVAHVVLGGASLVASCPSDPQDDPPPVALRARLFPAELAVAPCTSQIDSDGDGASDVIEVNTVVDGVVVEHIVTTDLNGIEHEVLLPLRGALAASENHTTDGLGVPQRYGNTRFDNDDAGRVLVAHFEGSDARFPLVDRFFTYANDLIVETEDIALNPQFSNARQRFSYDDQGRVVQSESDANGDDDFESVATAIITDHPNGDVETFVERRFEAQAATERSLFDRFGLLYERDNDTDGDGDIDASARIVIEDGRYAGYDMDDDGDGVVDRRLVDSFDEQAMSFRREERRGDAVTSTIAQDFSCYRPPATTCPAGFVETEALACARFRFAPPMDFARADAAVAVLDNALIVTGGFPSFVLSSILDSIEVVDVDADDGQTRGFVLPGGSPVALDDGDRLIVGGGMRNGVVSTALFAVTADAEERLGELQNPVRLGNVVLFAGKLLISGGLSASDLSPAVAQTWSSSEQGRSLDNTPAPLFATLTVIDDDFAVHVGGERSSGNPSAGVVLYARLEGDRVTAFDTIPLPRPRSRHTALMHNGTLLVVGGASDLGTTASVLVGSLDRTSLSIGFTDGPDLPIALERTMSARLPDGRVLVAGGFDVDGVASRRSFVFDGVSWAEGPPLAIARAQGRAVALDDGRVAVIGGLLREGAATSAIEVLEQAPTP